VKKLLVFLLMFACAGAIAADSVRAQSFLEQLFGRWPDRNEKKEEKPREEVTPLIGTVYNSSNDAINDPKRQTKPTEFVVVIGDTMADQLAQGLAEAFFTERAEVAIVKKVRASSGMVRADFYDWIAEANKIIASEPATAFVIMLGANDRQPLRAAQGAHEFRSDRWREIYSQRIDQLLSVLKEKRVSIFFMGLPPTSSPRLTNDMAYINEIIRERSVKAEVRYVDIWEAFVDDKGQYVSTGPALDGQTRRLRLGDGIHFTRFGARKLAHYPERDLIRLFDARQRGPVIPFGTDGGPQIPGVKPLAGPILPLTMPIAPQGGLLGAKQNTNAVPGAIDPNAAKTLVEGVPQAAVPGRADDFGWPNRAPLVLTPTPN